MTVKLIQRGSVEFQRTLDAVTRELVSIQDHPTGTFITTPLTYPGGSAVVIRVAESEHNFFVSDFGMGLEEAEAMGVNSSAFSRYAHAIAEATGTRFDNHSFFVMEATREQLAGAIVAVANASQGAVIHTAFRLADRTGQTDDLLFARLELAFRGRAAKVIRSPTVKGYSTTPWPVDAMVQSGRHLSIFQSVSNHRLSVASAAMKLGDIARNDNAPRRFAVVHSKAELGTLLTVLKQSAHVIEESLPDADIIRLAEAA